MTNVEVLSSFLPPIIIRRCRQRRGKLSEPFRANFQGAVLFADISGFTALAESLSKKGIAGGEELTRILNEYFTRLIQVISEQGGEIVKFAGDALLALWTADDSPDSRGDVTMRAVACGISIQRDLGSFQATPDVRLSLRIGIGTGELAELYLGGVFGRWEFLFTGTPIAQMGIACAQGKPGDVMVSAEVWAMIADCFQGEAREEGNVKVLRVVHPIPPRAFAGTRAESDSLDSLQAYIPAAIRSRLEADQSGWIGELRKITILFVNLPDLKFDTPLDVSQKVMQGLQESLYRYEGSINKLSIDEKGVTLVAALGLPPLAHEDDAARGVLAGMAIQAALKKQGVRCSVGISRGRVFCGVVGCEARREYTVIGDTVNLSARLMQAAKGGILCDGVTAQEAGGHIRFTSLPPIHLKGKTRDVPIFRPESEIQPTLPAGGPRSMVGRGFEKSLFLELLQNLELGRNDLLVLEGEAGIGKSTLLLEFRQMAASRGIPVFSGWGDSLGRTMPLLAWRQVFASILGFDGPLPSPVILREALTAFGSGSPEFSRLTPLLNDFLPADFPDTPEARELKGEGRAARLRQFLIDLLLTGLPRPFVLTFDDGHWMDATSWTLIRSLAQAGAPVLIVIFMRPGSQVERFENPEILKQPETRRLGLKALSREETRELILNRLSVREFPGPALDLIFQQSDGNPFFIEEALLALRDSGQISLTSGACTLGPEFAQQKLLVSDTLEGIISGRIDRLSPQKQLALKVASVVGHSFSFNVVHDIYPIAQDRARLVEYFSQLAQEDLLREECVRPDWKFRFRQMMIREVTYNLMLFSQRQELHEAIAGWLESRPERDSLTYYPLLAHHWEMAGRYDRASRALEEAGNKAFWMGAFAECLDYFRRLFALVGQGAVSPDPMRLAGWYFRSGMARYSLGEIALCTPDFREALRILQVPIPETLPEYQKGFLVELLSHVGLEALAPLRKKILVSEAEAERANLMAGCHEMLSSVYQYNNEREKAGYHVYRFLRCAETAGERGIPHLGLANGIMALMTGVNGGAFLGDIYANRSRRLLGNHGNGEQASTTNLILGLYELGMGRLSMASGHLVKGMEQSRHIGLIRAWEEGCLFQAITLVFRGEHAAARALARELDHSGRCAHDYQSVAYACLIPALIALREGAPDTALRILDDMEKAGVTFTELQGKSSSHAVRVLAHWQVGNRETARQLAGELSTWLSRTVSISIMMFFGRASLAEFAIRSYEVHPSGARKQAVHAALFQLKFFARSFRVARPMLYILRGQAARLFNGAQEAGREWKKAWRASRKLGMPFEAHLAKTQLAGG